MQTIILLSFHVHSMILIISLKISFLKNKNEKIAHYCTLLCKHMPQKLVASEFVCKDYDWEIKIWSTQHNTRRTKVWHSWGKSQPISSTYRWIWWRHFEDQSWTYMWMPTIHITTIDANVKEWCLLKNISDISLFTFFAMLNGKVKVSLSLIKKILYRQFSIIKNVTNRH